MTDRWCKWYPAERVLKLASSMWGNPMSAVRQDEILRSVRDLPEEEQLEIARGILQHSELAQNAQSAQISRLVSLLDKLADELATIRALLREAPLSPRPPASAMSLRGIASMGNPPDDATVDRWLDEHRMEKYGG